MNENCGMQETIFLLRQQIDSLSSDQSYTPQQIPVDHNTLCRCQSEGYPVPKGERNSCLPCEEKKSSDRLISFNEVPTCRDSQLSILAGEIESMKQVKLQIIEENDCLKVENQKLSEEASYAKELATAAAVELQNLAEEITKLSYQNAVLSADLIATKEASSKVTFSHTSLPARLSKKNSDGGLPEAQFQQQDGSLTLQELQLELSARYKREASLVAALSDSDKLEGELRKKLEAAKRYEEAFESELANMWALVAKIRRSIASKDSSIDDLHDVLLTTSANGNLTPVSDKHENARDDDRCEDTQVVSSIDELNTLYHGERKRCKELEGLLSKLNLKGDTGNLHILRLDEVENLHVEAIAKICHAKCTDHSL